MRAKRLILLAASISLAALWGCSSSMDSAGGKSEVDDSYENVGFDVCISCHDLTGLTWLASRHGNSNYSPSSQNVPGESSCAVCHNPLDDAALIPATYGTNIARRDIIACESCHGGGSRHYGLGPIPYPVPSPDICGACHNRDDRHAGSENSIYDKWEISKHAKSPRSGIVCQRCHSNEGAIAADSYGYTGNKDRLGSSSDPGRNAPPEIPVEDLSSVQCATCHDVHDAGKLRTVYADRSEEPWDPNLNGSNFDQFDVCTSCHNLFDNDGATIIASGSAVSGTAPYYHDTTWYRIIASTHYDQPTNSDGCDSSASSIIEGYNVRKDSENPCFDCHGHEAITNTRPYPEGDDRDAPTTWTEWSSSAHGGHLFQVKLEAASEQAGGGDPADAPNNTGTVDAVMFAGITGETGEAWTFYNWDHPERAACQRCHTATGAMNFMDATANDEEYEPDNNDFSHLSGWVAGEDCGSPQNEVLYCWGCHSDNDGGLRNPGPITEEYDPAVIVEFPDINDSNVCMTCHLGREAGEVIKTKTGFDDLRFVNSHYLAAGGTVFAATGYTFGNRDYSIPADDTHVNIGWRETGNPVVDSYTTGPCVTCHFDSNDGPHTLSPFTQYGIDDLALNPVCVNCHTSRGEGSDAANAWLGTDFTLDDLVAGVVGPHKGRYLAALEALNVQLAENGFIFTPDFPNFSNTNWLSSGDTDVTGNTTGKNNMGSAFNYNLLIVDPGGVAHNRRYTRRLIYDAIDWLDDNVLNYSVAATLNALSDATDYKASAISYLLKAENGDAGDRH